MTAEQVTDLVEYLKRIAEAQERLSPPPKKAKEDDKDKKENPVRTA